MSLNIGDKIIQKIDGLDGHHVPGTKFWGLFAQMRSNIGYFAKWSFFKTGDKTRTDSNADGTS